MGPLCGIASSALLLGLCVTLVAATEHVAAPDGCDATLWDRFWLRLEESGTPFAIATSSHSRLLSHLHGWGWEAHEMKALVECVTLATGKRPLTAEEMKREALKHEIYETMVPPAVRFVMDSLALHGTTLKHFLQTSGIEGVRGVLLENGMNHSEAEFIAQWGAQGDDHESILQRITDPLQHEITEAALERNLDYQQPRWMVFHLNVLSELAQGVKRTGLPLTMNNAEVYNGIRDVFTKIIGYINPYSAKVAIVGGHYPELIPFDLLQPFRQRVVIDPNVHRTSQEVSMFVVLASQGAITLEHVHISGEDYTLLATPMMNAIRLVAQDPSTPMEDIVAEIGPALRRLNWDSTNSPRNVVQLRGAKVMVVNMALHDIVYPMMSMAQAYLYRLLSRRPDMSSIFASPENFLQHYAADTYFLIEKLQRSTLSAVADAAAASGSDDVMIVVNYVNETSTTRNAYHNLIFPNELRRFLTNSETGPWLTTSGRYHYVLGTSEYHWYNVVTEAYRWGGTPGPQDRPRQIPEGLPEEFLLDNAGASYSAVSHGLGSQHESSPPREDLREDL